MEKGLEIADLVCHTGCRGLRKYLVEQDFLADYKKLFLEKPEFSIVLILEAAFPLCNKFCAGERGG